MTLDEPQTVRWTAEQFLHMLDLGWFEGRRVEFLNGEIVEMAAQYDIHLAGITLGADALRLAFGPGFWVRVQGSLDLSPLAVPDPDLAVVAGSPRGAGRAITRGALLIVEVSESSLGHDRTFKGSLYAASGIADYWVLNLVQRQLEVYRNPITDLTAVFGMRYSPAIILDLGDFVVPLAAPQARIAVADLLP